jgi:hypothetical protein
VLVNFLLLSMFLALIMEACLDEGISSFYPPIIVYIENPYRNKK